MKQLLGQTKNQPFPMVVEDSSPCLQSSFRVSQRLVSCGTDCLSSGLPFQGCLHSEAAWRTDMVSVSRTKDRLTYSPV